MYIVELTYKVDLNLVEIHLNDHITYLDEQYQRNNFLASGAKVPRTGGIILSNISNRNELLKIIAKDPFKINNIADYSIIEFNPTKTSKELNFLIK